MCQLLILLAHLCCQPVKLRPLSSRKSACLTALLLAPRSCLAALHAHLQPRITPHQVSRNTLSDTSTRTRSIRAPRRFFWTQYSGDKCKHLGVRSLSTGLLMPFVALCRPCTTWERPSCRLRFRHSGVVSRPGCPTATHVGWLFFHVRDKLPLLISQECLFRARIICLPHGEHSTVELVPAEPARR